MEKQVTNDIKFRQSNNFIESRFSDFTLLELKAFEYLASQTKKADIKYVNNKMDKIIDVKLIDLAKMLNMQSEHMYNEISNIVDNLFNKKAGFKFLNEHGKIVHRSSRFVNNIDYCEGVFTFRINYEVLDYFVNIKKEYTDINLKYIAALNSTYAIKLYKLLKQYQKIKKRCFTLKDLKDQLGIIDTYKKYSHLKEKVIELAVNKINEGTDLQIEFFEIKVGRAIDSIEFKIEYK